MVVFHDLVGEASARGCQGQHGMLTVWLNELTSFFVGNPYPNDGINHLVVEMSTFSLEKIAVSVPARCL